MALSDPISAYLAAADMKNQNKRNMYSDIAGIGQGLGQGMEGIGTMIQEKKKRDIVNQLIQAISTQGAPQQGPQMPTGPAIRGPQGYVPPGAGPSAVPAGQMPMPQNPQSGMGGPPQDNTAQLKGLLMKADPQGMMSAMEGQMFQTPMNPLQQSEILKNKAQAAKDASTNPNAALEEKKVEFQQKLAEIARQKEADRQMRELIAKLAAGNRSDIASQGNDIKAQTANSRRSLWQMIFGDKVQVPGQGKSSGGAPRITNVQVTQ